MSREILADGPPEARTLAFPAFHCNPLYPVKNLSDATRVGLEHRLNDEQVIGDHAAAPP